MLEELRIRGLGVIEESVLELGPGFTAITGETGAGKTMVVTALGLLLGGRADSGAVRSGAGRARVEGLLDVSTTPAVVALVDDSGGEVEDGRVLLARQVSAEGRSRGYAGGAGVPAALLAEVGEALVTVHGQTDQHRLLRPGAQREALDRYAGSAVTDMRGRFTASYDELKALDSELDELTSNAREREREADLLRFGLEEVERIAPQPDEDEQLAAEESRLGFADTLRTAASQTREALSSDEGGGPDALGAVSAARRLLDGVREHDPQAAQLADRLAELSYVLSDLAADVASYASGLDSDPARLAAVSERRAALAGLTRKYGETVADVLSWAETAAARLLLLEDSDGRIAALRGRRTELVAELAEVGALLSAARADAGARLGAAVTRELHALAMPHAGLTVSVRQSETADGLPVGERVLRATPSGFDEVELLLAANAGAEPRSLDKGASGGELSRVMLALEVVLAGTDPVPTFVFDEVDAGVGGKAAIEVGRRLAMLAGSAQVVAVTHLPQVAAYADRHVVIEKSDDGSVTTSGLTVLDDDGRLRELSRMLAGLEDSDTARAHARELLDAARATA